MFYKSLLLTGSLFLFCCKTNQNIVNQETNSTMISDDQKQLQSLPPDFCRIIGKIISIKPNTKENSGNSPCGNHPCEAEVMIEKVLGYGSSFSNVLYAEQIINIHFAFTLQSSKEAFPNKNVIDLPGLKEGDKFEANMRGGSLLKDKYIINEYVFMK